MREKKELDHPDALTIIKDLSIAYSIEKKERKLQEMETLEKEIQEKFDIKQQTNPIVAFKLTNLTGRYQAEYNYQEAEKLYKETLKIQKEKWDKDHPSLLSDINFVAGVYKDQRKYQKAERLHKEILDKRKNRIRKKTFQHLELLSRIISPQISLHHMLSSNFTPPHALLKFHSTTCSPPISLHHMLSSDFTPPHTLH